MNRQLTADVTAVIKQEPFFFRARGALNGTYRERWSMISLITLIIAGAYVGWNIGANDAGNCIGTSVGSGLLTFCRAVILVSVFAIAGGYL